MQKKYKKSGMSRFASGKPLVDMTILRKVLKFRGTEGFLSVIFLVL